MRVCEHRPWTCHECAMEVKFFQKDKHLARECEMRVVSCNWCGQEVVASAVARHKIDACACRYEKV